jgi:T-complex protein 1 subunit delta
MQAGPERKFAGREKQRDVRRGNIIAAKAVADLVRTSLGPKGMDKMITSSDNEVIITNDGATILQKMEVIHPAAKMLVDMSKAQDVEAGDGTTSVVVIAGALLQCAEELLAKGLHPSSISDAWLLAQAQAVEILKTIAIKVDLSEKEQLVHAAVTALNSKVVSSNSSFLAPLSVDAVLAVTDDLKNSSSVDLSNIRIIKKLGGTVDDTELVNGMVFDCPAKHTAGGPREINGCNIGLIQFCLSAPKTNMENALVVSDYAQVDRLLREENQYIINLLKPIVKAGCNVLLIQKSILRDATSDLALSLLAKKGIMVITDIERSEIEFIANSLGCTPVADCDGFTAAKLGHADQAIEESTPSGSIVKILGVKNAGKTATILVRGSNRLVIDEAERSVHDALCVVRSLVKLRYLIPGGGAPETELCLQLEKYGDSLGGMVGYCIREYARAFEIIPYTLAENAGLNPVKMVTELRNRHALGDSNAGINVRTAQITNILEEDVLQPLLVSASCINLATECVRMILKIDDIVAVR